MKLARCSYKIVGIHPYEDTTKLESQFETHQKITKGFTLLGFIIYKIGT